MLKVNSVFGPTIQGEGRTQGRPVMFLRLGYCNLSCGWCDTKYTWDWKNYDVKKEVRLMDQATVLAKLEPLRAVVISGGEPMLQQTDLLPLIVELKRRGYWIEIETNGTIAPRIDFFEHVDQFNCSPKLSNSGDSRERRVKPKALEVLARWPKVFFKFVIGSRQDVEEVWEYVNTFQIPTERVYLMPLGKTQEELTDTTLMTKMLAREHGFVFSSRLHVELWGTKRDV